MLRKSLAAALGLLVLALSILPRPALAAWTNISAVNLAVSTAANNQQAPVIVSDGAGGAIVTWDDSRSGNTDIYAQHILASGVVDPAWPANGRAICTAASSQNFPRIASDGAGGAIITWQDFRGGANAEIFAQRVLASGIVDPAWPVDGRSLCPTAASGQEQPVITSDGAGGAIVAWQDFRNGPSSDVFAQRVLASGVVDPAWPVDGRALCIAGNEQNALAIVSDGTGGAVVTWHDFRGSATTDIYAQRVKASGAIEAGWPVDGRVVCAAANSQENPTLVADGSGGAIVTWHDRRVSDEIDIYAQHILSGGVVDAGWPVNGRALCAVIGAQQFPTIASDGAAGAIVTWQDNRGGATSDIYVQHVFSSGVVDAAWPADGRALCTATDSQVSPHIIADDAGGAIVTWYDVRTGPSNYDIYAQHVMVSGAVDPVWPVNGRALSTASEHQQHPRIVTDGAGGAIVAWYDLRSGSSFDVYAQSVARFGYLGTPEAEIIAARDVPNDNGGKVRLSWNASYLDSNSDPNLAWYEIYRSVPPHYASMAVARGARALRDFAEAPASGSEAVVMGAAGYAWEYLTTQNALHYIPSYSYLAPTASDSTGYQNPRTALMIVARNTSGSMYWLSRPDSGYSVDNLPPLPPAPFAGQFGSGVANLHWSPNGEIDLANYRLYRGTSAGFTPTPANRIATPSDTLYDDPAGTLQYYKLSAVDIHGNESGYTTLLPTGTTEVPPSGSLEMALEPPAPNPALDRVALRYALPREARVLLAIYDPSGRMVRRLVDGVVPAGAHQQAWDLRDGSGHAVGAGLYFIRLEADGRNLVRRMMTIR